MKPCDDTRFSCPPTLDPSDTALRSNDGCNSFCEIETSFGWVCTPGPEEDGFGGTFIGHVCLLPCFYARSCWSVACLDWYCPAC